MEEEEASVSELRLLYFSCSNSRLLLLLEFATSPPLAALPP